jgi:hypothetical protein
MSRRFLFFVAVASLAIMVMLSGCAWLGRPDPDPLAGWKGGDSLLVGNPYAKAILDDYHKYVEGMSAKERKFVRDYNTWFYHDETGKHAIRIALAYDSTFWDHILIYGPDNRRIRTIKRFGGHYRS